MSRSLEQVLADYRGEAAVLRMNGHKAQAESIERVCDDVARSLEAYLDWLEESEAMARSAKGVDFYRNRFSDWEAQGLAKWHGRRRYYRRIVVPRRANLEAARAQAERDARRTA